MKRILFLAYGLGCYLTFVLTFVYMVGFVNNFHFQIGDLRFVPVSIDVGGSAASTSTALMINTALIALFGVQHSGMARRGFKAMWTRVLVPSVVERSTYVLASSLCLILLMVCWRPMPEVIWAIHHQWLSQALIAFSLLGFGITLVASFLINHFELFGLQQVSLHARETSQVPIAFATPGFYKLVRHPIYVGFLLFVWVTPVMTVGHLLFAVGSLVYILIGYRLEEKDLIHQYGDTYRHYQERVHGLLPFPKGKG